MISSFAISPEPALSRKSDGYITSNMAILAPSVPSIVPHFTAKGSWAAVCSDTAPIPAKQKRDAPKAAPLQATICIFKNSQTGENHSHIHKRIMTASRRIVSGNSSGKSTSGRIDKRKRRYPTRSLPAQDSECDSRCFHTVKMSFVDDYQRNPTAYSRALMDTERPNSGSHRNSSRHMDPLSLPGTNAAGNMHSGALSAPASTTSFCHRIHPPLPVLSPSTADTSKDALLRENNQLKRVYSSSASLSSLEPLSSMLRTQSPGEQPEPSQLQSSERRRPPELRKSMSAAIQRLFPSLKDSINALATSSSQACAESDKPAVFAYKIEPTKRCSAAIMRPSAISGLGLETPPNQLFSSTASARNIRPPLHHSKQQAFFQRYPRHSDHNHISSSRSSTPLSTNGGAAGIDQFITDDLSREIFQLKPRTASCSVKWAKAAPMDVSECAFAEHLATAERDCCSILRLYPEQYLTIKQSLVRAGRTLPPGTFKKRDAQKLCRVDVNKTSKVFEWFCKLGWIPHASTKPNTGNNSSNIN
ncbi:hypothetical protein FB645_006192 [Coemansia sp. IMI 203386]|nr:hypothetical protein FB645_006192 [Coemansia sp. IMI 203386]